jgi:type II secretory pathway predicted ATPase ExeA
MNAHADRGGADAPFLTYEPFYGLTEKPFSLASDPAFFYKSAAHRAAFDALGAGIRRREGLIVLSGEIGTGKTTLCRAVLAQLDRKTFSTFVPDPFVTREDLLKTLLVGFGVVSVTDLNGGRLQGASRQDLSYPLYEFLDSLVPLQAFAVLVIDEAQNLSLGVMEEIRILAELEKREKLLQVVLVGQPELRDNLRLPQMRQVEQRVTVRCDLSPLSFGEVIEYVNHRLAVAAAQPGSVAFTGGALEAVHLASGGVPRLINLVCDRALQRAFDLRRKTIDRDTVAAAARDLDLGDRPPAEVTSRLDDVLPLPFDDDTQGAGAAAPAHAFLTEETGDVPPAVPATAPAAAADDAGSGTAAFVPESSLPHMPAATPANPLAEFDSEPETPPDTPDVRTPLLSAAAPPARGVFWMLARAVGLATAGLGIAVGAGVLDTRAALDRLVPVAAPAPPPSPDRTVALAGTALPVADTLTAALTDGRAHEPDAYSVLVANLRDRTAAEGLVAELAATGYRAHWAEVRSDDEARQQVFVNGYGTLEDALGVVTRLRQRPSTADAWIFQLPGAARRIDAR